MSTSDELVVLGLAKMLGQTVHLTGSRYFGTQKQHSDYDVFTKMSKSVQTKLSDAGFSILSKQLLDYYTDENTIEVWRNNNIDVQLVKDVKSRLKIGAAMLKSGAGLLLASMNKQDRKVLWRLAYVLTQSA